MRAAACTPRTGDVIGMHISYSDEGDVVLASQKGQFIRMELNKIKRLGRDTQGVTLMKLHPGDKVSSVALILSNGVDSEDETENLALPLGPNTPKSDSQIDKSAIEMLESDDNQVLEVKENKIPHIAIHGYDKNKVLETKEE